MQAFDSMRQIVNLICVSAFCLGLSFNTRKSLNRLKVFARPSDFEKITALDAIRRDRIIQTFQQKTTESKPNSDFDKETKVFLPTPNSRKADEGLKAAGMKSNKRNLETIQTDTERLFETDGWKLNTDDNDTYYFGDDLNLTDDIRDFTPQIFVTPSPLVRKNKKAPRNETEIIKYLAKAAEVEKVTPQTLQSLYKSDFKNKTLKLSLNFPSPSTNFFQQSDLYNQSLDQLFSSPTLSPETPETGETNEYPFTLVVPQSEGQGEGFGFNDNIVNDIFTPAFTQGFNTPDYDFEYTEPGKPQSR